jgi:phosphoribosylglycinamide formyltransferase-1
MKRIAIFASGNGSNAQRIVEYFSAINDAEVALILSNRKDAYVLERAQNLGIPAKIFDRKTFYSSDEVLHWLKKAEINLVVLAGFLWLIPSNIIAAFPSAIVNIHPALLPKFGGTGMFGEAVHRAVIEAGEKESGITIHFVDEKYDHGNIIFQAKCAIEKGETPTSLAMKIHELEYEHFPGVIEQLLANR